MRIRNLISYIATIGILASAGCSKSQDYDGCFKQYGFEDLVALDACTKAVAHNVCGENRFATNYNPCMASQLDLELAAAERYDTVLARENEKETRRVTQATDEALNNLEANLKRTDEVLGRLRAYQKKFGPNSK